MGAGGKSQVLFLIHAIWKLGAPWASHLTSFWVEEEQYLNCTLNHSTI